MPLSEDEQRILAEIEKNLHESDPRLAREVSETTVYRHALGPLKWSLLGIVLGVVVMVATLPMVVVMKLGCKVGRYSTGRGGCLGHHS